MAIEEGRLMSTLANPVQFWLILANPQESAYFYRYFFEPNARRIPSNSAKSGVVGSLMERSFLRAFIAWKAILAVNLIVNITLC
jgi:hypothetical protein